jgi:hypothetical protein
MEPRVHCVLLYTYKRVTTDSESSIVYITGRRLDVLERAVASVERHDGVGEIIPYVSSSCQ